jgi:hypothetical protein
MPAVARRRVLPKPAPEADPRFRRVMEQLKQGSARTKQHPPAARKAKEAGGAAKGPPNERMAAGKARQVEKIEEAPTKKPEKTSFLSILRAEIQKAMPQTLGDTEKFMKGGSSGELKGGLKGNVNQQKDEAAGGVKSANKEQPREAGAAKDSQPIPPEPAPGSPPVDGPGAMPAPKPDADVSLQDSKQDADQQMKDAEVTPQQLQKANDPRFSSVLGAKDAVAKQADTAPGQYRATEKGVTAGAAAAAVAVAGKGAAAMVGVKRGSNSTVLTKQQQAKLKDEQARQKVVQQIEDVYNRTKTSVETKLANLETAVGAMFDAGVDAALNSMTEFVEGRMTRYKLERYLMKPFGLALWIKDQFVGLPDEVNVFYEQGRALFTGLMDALVVRVANLVESRLKEAKDEVKKGQADIQKIVDSQPKELRGVAESAQKDVAGRFEELERGIEDKKNSLAQGLAQKYKEAFDKANDALKKIQDDNKGLVAAFAEKLGEVIKILTEFKAKLMALLKKGADTIKLILADPIGFLGNLIAAIKLGLNQFIGNIWEHLKKGFFMWLFGALAEAGIEIPSGLPSLPSILQLVLSVLGITYERMRAKAVKLIGERAVTIIETLAKYVKALIEGGPAKLWEQIKSDLSDLKGMVIDAIQSYIVTTVAQRAIAKLVTLFNPVGAIVQAVLAIYDTVMFLIEKANQIMALVEAVINSVNAIATGAIGGAANWIEQALARAIPVVIGFLAQFVGLGKVSKKIKEFILKVQAKVDAAIDKVIAKVVAVVKKLVGKLTGKVETDIKAKFGAPVEEGADVQGTLGGIYGKFSADGLKSIEVGESGYADEFDVFTTASPKKKAGLIKTHLNLNMKDLDLSEPSTALTATFNGRDMGRRTSGGGQHAEEKLLGYFAANLKDEIEESKGKSIVIAININRSPCGAKTADEPDNHNCASQLAAFSARASKIAANNGKTFQLKLTIASLYGGQSSGEGSPAQLGLHQLLDAGVKIEAWDIVRALEKKGVKNINTAAKRPGIREKLSKRVAAFKATLSKIKKAKAGK